MESYNVTCHPIQRTHPALTPAGEGWYPIYLPRRDGRLSWPRCPIMSGPGIEPMTVSLWLKDVFAELTCHVERDAAAVFHDVRHCHLTVVLSLVVIRTHRLNVHRQHGRPDGRFVAARRHHRTIASPSQSRLKCPRQPDLADHTSWFAGYQLTVAAAVRHPWTARQSTHRRILLSHLIHDLSLSTVRAYFAAISTHKSLLSHQPYR